MKWAAAANSSNKHSSNKENFRSLHQLTEQQYNYTLILCLNKVCQAVDCFFTCLPCVRCSISPPRFLAKCRMRRLNQASFVLLYIALFAFPGLCLVFVVCLFLICLLCCISIVYRREWHCIAKLCWCAVKNLLTHILYLFHKITISCKTLLTLSLRLTCETICEKQASLLSSTRFNQVMSDIHFLGFDSTAFRSKAAPPVTLSL